MNNHRIPAFIIRFSDFVLIGAGIFSFALLGYSIYHHERYFASLSRMGIFYGIPALGAILFFGLLRVRPVARLYASLVVLSLGVSLYAAELVLTISSYRRAVSGGVAQEGADTRPKRELLRDLRAEGVEAYPAVIPEDLLTRGPDGVVRSAVEVDGREVLPLSGISNETTILCNEAGEWILYESDEHGFNNPKGIWDKPEIDIVAVGDSFTHGWCVSPDENFVARIRKVYPATLNLGMAGNGPLPMLAALREYAQELRPKAVFWFYYENDLANLEIEMRNSLLRSYLDPNFRQGLRDEQPQLDSLMKTYVSEQEPKRAGPSLWPHPMNFLGGMHLRNAFGFSGWKVRSEEVWSLLDEILAEARRTVECWGGRLYFVPLPSSSPYYNTLRAFDPGAEERERIVTMVQDLGIDLVDPHEAFVRTENPRDLFRGLDSHYNSQGHDVVAQTVLDYLARHLDRSDLGPERLTEACGEDSHTGPQC